MATGLFSSGVSTTVSWVAWGSSGCSAGWLSSGCCVCAVEDFSAPSTLRVETSAPLEVKIEQYALRGIHEKEGA